MGSFGVPAFDRAAHVGIEQSLEEEGGGDDDLLGGLALDELLEESLCVKLVVGKAFQGSPRGDVEACVCSDEHRPVGEL